MEVILGNRKQLWRLLVIAFHREDTLQGQVVPVLKLWEIFFNRRVVRECLSPALLLSLLLIGLFALEANSDNINHTNHRTVWYFNIRLVWVFGKYIWAWALFHEVNLLDLVTFVENVLAWRRYHRFEERADPRDETLSLPFQVIKILIQLLIDY